MTDVYKLFRVCLLDHSVSGRTQADRIQPANAEAYSNRGNPYRLKGQHDRAISDCSESIRLNPDFAPAFSNRGAAYLNKGNLDRAIVDCDQAIRLEPDFSDAYNARGGAYGHKGDLDRAIVEFSEAIRLKPDFADALNNLGATYAAKGKFDKAIVDYTEAIRLDPKNVNAYTGIAWIRATCPEARYRDGKKAVENARKACELTDWKVAASIGTLGAAYAAASDFEQAINFIKRAMKMEPNSKSNENRKKMLAAFQARKPYREKPK